MRGGMDVFSLRSLAALVIIISASLTPCHAQIATPLILRNLYPDNSPVISLEQPTFYTKVQDSDKSWLVLFYASWCGHCINYVPTYISIADKLQAWRDYVGVAAVNCAKPSNAPICRDHNISGYPTLVFVPSQTKNTSVSNMPLAYRKMSDVDFVTAFVEKAIKAKYTAAKPRNDTDVTTTSIIAGKDQNGEKNESLNRPNIVITQYNSSMLFYEDLVYALKYSLVTEVGLHSDISADAVTVLKDYVSILSKCFPESNQDVSGALNNLNRRLSSITVSISHKQWTKLLSESGLIISMKGKDELIRCRGSISKYRGYPCSLWSLFHTLSIQASVPTDNTENKTIDDDDVSSHSVLLAMRGYIANFFSCVECSNHFAKMAVQIDTMTDKSNQASVLWLWSVHNKVNMRLAGDTTEDPMFPKIQFPSQQECPHCKTPKGIWDEAKVLAFLNATYTRIIHGDSNTEDTGSVIPTIQTDQIIG